jgi:glycosyltransferase involved in cell wall biosynthesis
VTESDFRVSVIIPCFNDGATLEEAVGSALDQRGTEIAVVDDGSTDPVTLNAFERVRRLGVHVTRQVNAGPAAARTAGLSWTSAPYVFPLDADDLLAPGALSTLADALDADPDLCAVWGDIEMFGEATSVVRTPEAIDPWSQTYLNEMPGPALFRRAALEAVGGWRLRLGYEDWDIWLSLAEQGGKGRRIPIVSYRYRAHGRRGWHTHSTYRHEQIVAELQRLHPALFANRRKNWAQSRAPWRLRLGLPVVSRLPLGTRARLAFMHLLSSPITVSRLALERRLSRVARERRPHL